MKLSVGFGLHTLEVFGTVCELGSMTLAAKRLGMTQPAVSQAIKQMEAAVGVTLLHRGSRPLTPTSAGYWLVSKAAQVLHDAQQIPIAIKQFDRGLELRMRIGLIDTLSVPFVPAMVTRLKSSIRYMSISAGLARTLRLGLTDRSLDLIIVNDPMDDVDGLQRHHLLTESYILVVPHSIIFKDRNVDIGALSQALPFIRWNAPSYIGADIELQLRRMRLTVPRRFEFASVGTILGMVASGLGWSIVTPLSIFEMSSMLSKIAIVPFPGPSFTRSLYLIARQGDNDRLAEEIASVSRKILRTRYLTEMGKVGSWLKDKFLIAS